LPQGSSLRSSADFEPLTLIEMSDVTGNQVNYLTWEGWSRQMGQPLAAKSRWLRFNYAYQTVQAALAGQGLMLARLPLVVESLENGSLLEPLPALRLKSPIAYWLIVRADSLERPEVLAFSNWVQLQALATRKIIQSKNL
jgi:DNA-binding transcriptional LysR family regulator